MTLQEAEKQAEERRKQLAAAVILPIIDKLIADVVLPEPTKPVALDWNDAERRSSAV